MYLVVLMQSLQEAGEETINHLLTSLLWGNTETRTSTALEMMKNS